MPNVLPRGNLQINIQIKIDHKGAAFQQFKGTILGGNFVPLQGLLVAPFSWMQAITSCPSLPLNCLIDKFSAFTKMLEIDF